MPRFQLPVLLAIVLMTACSSNSTTPSPASRTITDFVTGLESSTGVDAQQQSGVPPASVSGGPAIVAPPGATLTDGGTDGAELQGSTPFQTVYFSVNGTSSAVTGFYKLVLPQPTTDTTVYVTVAHNVPEATFNAVFQVASANGAVGPAVSARTIVDPQSCAFSVTPAALSVPATGGVSTITVSAAQGAACAWSASSDSSFIVVSGGANGVGAGTVTTVARPNPDDARTASVSVAGQIVRITQPSLGQRLTPVACGTQTRSLEGTTPTTIAFFNARAGYVRIFWLDYGGVRQPYNVMGAGEAVSYSTFVTHPWVATDLDGNCLSEYLPLPQAGAAIVQ